jgi:AraC-like DNA-binding protein
MRLIYHVHNTHQSRTEIRHEKIAFYDLTFLLEGTMHWKINGKEFTINSGDVFLIPKFAFRERKPVEGCNYYSFNFFSDEQIDLPFLIENGITNEIRLLLSACDEIQKSVLEFSKPLEHTLGALLSVLISNFNANMMPPVVQNIKLYIAQHIHEPLTLEEITNNTFFSTVHCSSVFKRETGQSIIDYVLDEKMKLAKRYIFENTPLRQVAEAVGFSDYNYFSRMFKKRTGVTPMQYKHSLSMKK